MALHAEPLCGGVASFPTVYVADRHGTDGVRAILGHLHRAARRSGVRPPRVLVNPAPTDVVGCGSAILLLVDHEPAAAEALISGWKRGGAGPMLAIILCHSLPTCVLRDRVLFLPSILIDAEDILLEHGGRALLADSDGDAIDAGLAALARAEASRRRGASCPLAA
jgi:hypothetical protein